MHEKEKFKFMIIQPKLEILFEDRLKLVKFLKENYKNYTLRKEVGMLI